MDKYRVGKNYNNEVLYVTTEQLKEIKADLAGHKSKYTNQQWAKIRKLCKKV